MKKSVFLTLLFMAVACMASAQAKKVAILETVDKEGNVPYGIRLQLRSNLTYAISNTPGYEGYDRVDVASIMDEHNFQRTGMVSDDQIRQLGEMTGCSSILVTEAALYDNSHIIITAKVLNVETASVENSAPPQIASTVPAEMQEACRQLAAKLIDNAFEDVYSQGVKLYKEQNYETAISLFEQAAATDNVENQYRAFIYLALCNKNIGEYIQAREWSKRAMQVSPKSGKPYVIIAQLYAESSDQFDGTIAKKAVFWAAVDKCRKAMRIDPSIYEEANALVVEYEKRFPTPEELFFEEYEWGKSYSVGGWIGESTIIRYYGKDGVEPKY